jgi:hypothetical protein
MVRAGPRAAGSRVPLFLVTPARPFHDGVVTTVRKGDAMPLVLALNVFVQLAFVIHAYRSGAPRYWVLVILAFPVAGCLAYYLFEVFPRSREAVGARRAARNLARAFDPHKDLRARMDEVQVCGSIDNRVALAEECLANGLAGEAVMLYRSTLAGAYEGDPHLRLGLARALVEQGAWDDAHDAVERLRRDHPCHKPNETRLLHARVLEGRGETESAAGEYRELVPAFVGLEARCRYGQLLERLGRRDEARAVFDAAVTQAKRNPSPIEAEARWAAVARDRLGALARALGAGCRG